jgi:ferredoxin-NADP reductase
MTFTSTHTETEQELVVVSRREVAQDTIEFEFAELSGKALPGWAAGAHIDLRLTSGLSRQYSLMQGMIDQNNWRIAVLVEREGRGGSLLIEQDLHEGSVVSSVGPRNHFPLTPADDYLFIAGGIGITPLLRMIEVAEAEGTPWRLAYLGRSPETMSYVAELQKRFGNRVEVFAKSQGQRFDVETVISQLNENAHVYSCGPERLMLALEEAMGSQGINRVHIERFHPREVVLDEPDHEFTVYCQKSDEEIVVPADESILMAADFAGIDIPGDCMEGTCGACETRVIEGEVDHRDSVLSAQARAEGDTMMICISRAKGKRLVIDL